MKFKKWKKIQKLDQNTKIISRTLETKSLYLSKNPIMNHYFTSFVSKKWSLKLVERPLMRFLHLLSSHFRRVWIFFCYFFLSEKKAQMEFYDSWYNFSICWSPAGLGLSKNCFIWSPADCLMRIDVFRAIL